MASPAADRYRLGEMPVTPPPSCMVIHCADYQRDPQHQVRIDGAEGACAAPVCVTHQGRIDQGEPWLWVPWQRLKAASSDLAEGCILMGEELAGYGLVVDADVRMNTTLVFGPNLAAGRKTTTLAIDGRLFGDNHPVSLELLLDPETVTRLKEALRFL
jgi:hypothetical protein